MSESLILKREPLHPGEILKYEFMQEMGISQIRLARDLGVDYKTINEIVNERRNISPKMALLLGKYFGVSVQSWLNLQNKYDLHKALKDKNTQEQIARIEPIRA